MQSLAGKERRDQRAWLCSKQVGCHNCDELSDAMTNAWVSCRRPVGGRRQGSAGPNRRWLATRRRCTCSERRSTRRASGL